MLIRKNRNLLVVVILVLLISSFPSFPSHYSAVFAQGATQIAVQPSAGDVIINNLKTISLYVTNGVNVNAFDVIITYNSSLLTLTSWSYGTYLSSLMQVVKTDTPGYFRLVATQLAKPGVNGDGNLLNLVFRGKVNGLSPIVIDKCEFATSEPVVMYSPERVSGSLLVHSDSALISKFLVTGTLTLQGSWITAGSHWHLIMGQPIGLVLTAVSQSINQHPTSAWRMYTRTHYLLTTTMPRYLNVTAELNKTIGIGSTKTTISALQLKGGNAVWQREVEGVWVLDSVIDAGDISLIGTFYGQSGSDLDADVNFSGKVDILDLALAAGNYDQTSALAYGSWVP